MQPASRSSSGWSGIDKKAEKNPPAKSDRYTTIPIKADRYGSTGFTNGRVRHRRLMQTDIAGAKQIEIKSRYFMHTPVCTDKTRFLKHYSGMLCFTTEVTRDAQSALAGVLYAPRAFSKHRAILRPRSIGCHCSFSPSGPAAGYSDRCSGHPPQPPGTSNHPFQSKCVCAPASPKTSRHRAWHPS